MNSSFTTTQQRTQQERGSLILGYLAYVSPILLHYASSFELEDLQQEAALTIMHCLDLQPAQANTLHHYIMRSVKFRMIALLRLQSHSTALSLDNPIASFEGGESCNTFRDVIPDTYNMDPLADLILREQLSEFASWL